MRIELKGSISAPVLDELVDRYFTMVYSTCLRITRNQHDAEDAAQATFLHLARYVDDGRDIRALGPWLYQVACNASVDICRRRKRQATYEPRGAKPEAGPVSEDPACRADLDELRPVVLEQLKKLPPLYRLPLILQYFGGLSQTQLAEQLGCSHGTLRVRLHRGHKLLRKALEKRGICLAGGLLGLILADVVRSQVGDSIASTAMAFTQHISQTALPSIPTHFLAGTHVAGHAGRKKVWIVVSLAVASVLAAGAPLLAKIRELPIWTAPLDIAPLKLPELSAPLPRLSSADPIPDSPIKDPNLRRSRRTALPPTPDLTAVAARPSSPSPPPAPTDLSSLPAAHTTVLPAPKASAPAVAATAADSAQPPLPKPYQSPAQSLATPHLTSGSTIVAKPPVPDSPSEAPIIMATTFLPADASPWKPAATPGQQIVLATTQGEISVLSYTVLANGERIAVLNSAGGVAGRYHADEPISTTLGEAIVAARAGQPAGTAVQILRNNGQVIANGYQEFYWSFDRIQNDLDNPIGGYNGWFAMNGGRLSLPPLTFSRGTHSSNWGEDPADSTPDLINSLRLTATASRSTSLYIDLLAPDAANLPTFPAGHHLISAYQLGGGDALNGSMSALIRYDDARLTYLGLNEQYVKLWYYLPAIGWQPATAGRDLANNWVRGNIPANADFIVVSTPEPGAVALISAAALFLLRRRRATPR